MDDREQKDAFFFHDIDSLRWFMMDSLWRTLSDNLKEENIYYTMNGGLELSFEELSSVRVFPMDVPYLGSPFYYAHADVAGDEMDELDSANTYFDANTGLLLTYPGIFSANGVMDENGIVNLCTQWDTSLLYWTDPNEGNLSPSQFRENLNLTQTMELMGNVVIGYGEVEDGNGSLIWAAYYWVVDTDMVVNVMIRCPDCDEAAYWYGEFQNRAFYVENVSGASEE